MVLGQLFLAFLRVGIFGFGGGPSFIPLMEQEVVNRYNWMTPAEFTDMLAAGNALPGPITTKMAAYIGFKVGGFWGLVAALGALVAPTALAMVLLIKTMLVYRDNPRVEGMLKAVRPVVVALLAIITIDVARTAFPGTGPVIVGLAAFFLLYFLKIHPAYLIAGSLLLGFFAFS